MEVTPLRHVDLYKRRPPENDSHCDLITQTLACFVEYFLKMFSMKELLLEKECLSFIYIFCKRFIKKDFLRPLYFCSSCSLALVLAEDLGIENK